MTRFDFYEDYAAPQPNGTTVEAKVIVSKRGDKRLTLEMTAFSPDGEQFCDQEVEFSSVEAARFARAILEGVKCAGAFDVPELEEVA